MVFIQYFNASVILVVVLLWVFIITYLRYKRKKNFIYLVLFTIFYVYLAKVLDYTLFQYQSLLLLKYVMPGIQLRGLTAKESLNLMPLITLSGQDLKTSLLNILLMIPFGLGLPFITNYDMKEVVAIGAVFSVLIESLQWATGQIAGTTFRVADINDVIFNTTGVLLGYLLFVVINGICRSLYKKSL